MNIGAITQVVGDSGMNIQVTGIGRMAVPGTYRLKCELRNGSGSNYRKMALYGPDGQPHPVEVFNGCANGNDNPPPSGATFHLGLLCTPPVPRIGDEWTIEVTE